MDARETRRDSLPADPALVATSVPSLQRLPDGALSASSSVLDFSALQAYEWLNIPAWVYDAEQFRHRWANAAGLQFWRSVSNEELCSRSYADTSPTTRARIALSMQAHARGERTYERWTLYPTGVPTSILLQGTGIRMPDGRIGILFMAELAMQIEPNVIRGIEALNHASVLVAVHRLSDGQALMRNPAAELAFGREEPSTGGNGIVAMFADAALGESVLASVRANEVVQVKAMLRTRPEPSWYMVGARRALDPATGEEISLFHASDVSELMNTQGALERARERAEVANRAKSAFLTTISHELRTPIAGVLGILHLLDRTRLADRQRRWVDMALDAGSALSNLIGDLVEFAAVEGGDYQPVPELIDLRAVVTSATDTVKPEAARKGLALSCAFAPEVPSQVVGDPRWVRRIVFNLVANAVKFTSSGSVDVAVGLQDVEGRRLCVRIDVTDTGSGVAPEQQEAIFRPFVQADQSMTRAHGGVGMGLTLVRKMVDRLGGFLELDSAPGQGSRFSVILPIA